MKTTSLLLSILMIIGVCDVREASSAIAAARDFLDTFNLTNCDDFKKRLLCAQFPYRTFDGTCNNLCNTDRGAIFRPFRRLDELSQPTAYEQPNFQPRRLSVINGKELPNARNVSIKVFQVSNRNFNDTQTSFTHLVMTWGQFIDHDITLTELEAAECGNNINACPQRPECTGIDILSGQGLRVNRTFRCIPMTRAFRTANGQQVNIITSYIDGSQVYGSNIEFANRLRGARKHGLLDVRPYNRYPDRPVLPPDAETFCRSLKPEEEPCFLAGDARANENHALTTMHVIWVREHNRIAKALNLLNPKWNDEKLFQEARKIVAAEIQHITYNEWLPVFFRRRVLDRERLSLERQGQFYKLYDPTVNPELINSVPTAALRMGHTLVRNTFILRNSRFGSSGFGQTGRQIPVADFYIPAPLFEEGNNPFGGIALGLTESRGQAVDGIFTEAVRERLNFEGEGFDGNFGDLPAINIQRGRDHGLPGYVKFREACGGRSATRFDDLADTIRVGDRKNLADVYRSVHDIDLFVGGILEIPETGSLLGPTFTHLLAQQFRDLREGDRFWYERKHESGFSLSQLNEIRKASISRIICDNADGVFQISKNGFRVRSRSNPRVRCEDLNSVDLSVFEEGYVEPQDVEAGGESIASASA